MDSFELNKIAGAVLFALLLAFGLGIVAELIFDTETPESPGYVIAVTDAPAGGAAAAAPQPIAVLLVSADPAKGQNSAKKCLACHTFGNGEPNKVGPNLWGVVERPIAAHEGYEYDDALHAYAEQAKTWTFEHLNTFLHDPKGTVPGTKMAFAGLKDDAERANVIAYLHTLSDSPVPLPTPDAAAAPADAAAPAAADAASQAPANAPSASGAEGDATPAPSGTPAETDPTEPNQQGTAGDATPAPATPAPAAPATTPAPAAPATTPAPATPAPAAASPTPAP